MTQQEYTALVDRCKQLSYEYYVLAQPTVSDAQFDALVSEIEQAEAEHPEWTLADSPTQMVGSDVDAKSGRRLIRHRTRMLSCDKARSQEELMKWIASREKKLKKQGDVHYVLEWKLDGISCSLVYQDGQLVSAATRGDKERGQDLLAHVMMMPSVPQQILEMGRVEVRGEIVCPKANLAALGYKDCRTAAAALCNQMVPSQDMKRLEFVAWQLDTTEGIGTESVGIDLAADQGFKTSGYRGCWSEDVLSRIDEFAARREALEWPTDGVVIKIDCRPLAASLGCTEHHPKGWVAYKFSAQKTVTRVTGIEISIGETGRRTPRALLVPVMILGREVKSVSLGSENNMKKLGVTEGCLVEVGLSNDVTPKIYRVVEDTVGTGSCRDVARDVTDVPVPDVSEVADAPALEGHTDITDGTDSFEAVQTTPDPSYSGGEAAAEVDPSSIDPRDEEIAALRARIAELEAQASPVIEPMGNQATETPSPCQASDTDGDSPSCSIEDSTEGTVPPVSPAAAEVEPSPVIESVGNQAIDIVVVTPRPTERERNAADAGTAHVELVPAVPRSQREILAERRHQRRLERERMQRSYEERMEREAREAEQAAREEQRRNVFAAIGAAAVTLALIYFFGLLGPAVFGLLCGGLLKG